MALDAGSIWSPGRSRRPIQDRCKNVESGETKTTCVIHLLWGKCEYFHPIPIVDRLAWRACYGNDPTCKLFFFVGRVDREKRLDVIIRAIDLLNQEDIQFVIAGNGAAKVALIALTEELALEKKLHFTGFIPTTDLPSVLNSIDIFKMPVETELLSIDSLQAMACARPMLMADAVALPELVSANDNGLLLRTGDVEDAAHCMALLAEHPERWQAMGAASLERVKAHSLEKIVHLYEELYQAVLTCKKLPGSQ